MFLISAGEHRALRFRASGQPRARQAASSSGSRGRSRELDRAPRSPWVESPGPRLWRGAAADPASVLGDPLSGAHALMKRKGEGVMLDRLVEAAGGSLQQTHVPGARRRGTTRRRLPHDVSVLEWTEDLDQIVRFFKSFPISTCELGQHAAAAKEVTRPPQSRLFNPSDITESKSPTASSWSPRCHRR